MHFQNCVKRVNAKQTFMNELYIGFQYVFGEGLLHFLFKFLKNCQIVQKRF